MTGAISPPCPSLDLEPVPYGLLMALEDALAVGEVLVLDDLADFFGADRARVARCALAIEALSWAKKSGFWESQRGE
ncbi:MAG: hypothetical protein JKY65_33190 [Planctomycetes bacterium]|nr:hypothetical protein [Planctomycetota bacterium]